jgi:predicted short-subunit dehydrogenase-like oxidoreductase (DUF2520 family)
MKASITIIGFGRLGKLYHKSLAKAGYDQISVIRNGDDIVFLNDYVLISVPDDQIRTVVKSINESCLKLKGKTILHSSGIQGLDVFSTLDIKKVTVGCLHPLMAVSDTSETFEGITFDISGDDVFIKNVTPIVKDLDADLMVLSEAHKSKMHIAAVITSNYLVTLMGVVEELFKDQDLSQNQIKKALLPLMKTALNNLEHQTPAEALTGPISREDVHTVEKHLKLLESEPEIKKLYQQLGLHTLKLNELMETGNQLMLKRLFDET